MPMLRTIERPTKATLRPDFCAASSTCWTRCTWRGEAGDDDPPLRRARNTWSMRRGDLALGRGEAGHLGVGRVGEEQVDALLAEPGEGPQVGEPAVQRQLVHLEVAGVQHGAGRRADRDRERVGDGVVDRDELEVEGAEPLARRPP